ncbi:hypothetical protein DFA_04915 [Cavenderia fasciculata]|uniref:Ankyrin repeat-containing protein n=1 Tax=Cavenderia fasciculata TaxID=261658 RepID=F4PMD5_CACFS|nr:uncharacterized protein DFA_04915 [Cavenderia fasciculata]EGG22785.1 hypothetical protein DFA_04915 [Cavenderia fasciculata]|eukprot:XP_004360636.1 hypothetical protein DFA_04915 [Cavenderia fasciculata]
MDTTFYSIFRVLTIRLVIFRNVTVIHQRIKDAHADDKTIGLRLSSPKVKVNNDLEIRKGKEFHTYINLYESLRFGRTDLFFKYYNSMIVDGADQEYQDNQFRNDTELAIVESKDGNGKVKTYSKLDETNGDILPYPVKPLTLIQRSMVYFTVALYTNNIPLLHYLIDRLGLTSNYCQHCQDHHMTGLSRCVSRKDRDKDIPCHNHQMITFFNTHEALSLMPGPQNVHVDTVKLLLEEYNLTAILAIQPLVSAVLIKCVVKCDVEALQLVHTKVSNKPAVTAAEWNGESDGSEYSGHGSSSASDQSSFYGSPAKGVLKAFHLFLEKRPASEILPILKYWTENRVGSVEWSQVFRSTCSQRDRDGNNYDSVFDYMHEEGVITKMKATYTIPSGVCTQSMHITKMLFQHYGQMMNRYATNLYAGAVSSGNCEVVKYIYDNHNTYNLPPTLLNDALERGHVAMAYTLIHDIWPIKTILDSSSDSSESSSDGGSDGESLTEHSSEEEEEEEEEESEGSNSSRHSITIKQSRKYISNKHRRRSKAKKVPKEEVIVKWSAKTIKSNSVHLQFVNSILEQHERVNCTFEKVYGKAIKAKQFDVVARIDQIMSLCLAPWYQTFKIDYHYALVQAVKIGHIELVETIITSHHPKFIVSHNNYRLFTETAIGLEIFRIIASRSNPGDLFVDFGSNSNFWYHPEIPRLLFKYKHYQSYLDEPNQIKRKPVRRAPTDTESESESSSSESTSSMEDSYSSSSPQRIPPMIKQSKLFKIAIIGNDIEAVQLLQPTNQFFDINDIIGIGCETGNLEMIKCLIKLGYPVTKLVSLIDSCGECKDRDKAFEMVYYFIDHFNYRLKRDDMLSAVTLFSDPPFEQHTIGLSSILQKSQQQQQDDVTSPSKRNFGVFIKYLIAKLDKEFQDTKSKPYQEPVDEFAPLPPPSSSSHHLPPPLQFKVMPKKEYNASNYIQEYFTEADMVKILLSRAFNRNNAHVIESIIEIMNIACQEKIDHLQVVKDLEKSLEIGKSKSSSSPSKKKKVYLKSNYKPLVKTLECPKNYHFDGYHNHGQELLPCLDLFYYKSHINIQNIIKYNQNNNIKNNNNNNDQDKPIIIFKTKPVNPSTYRDMVYAAYKYGLIDFIQQRQRYKSEYPDTYFDFKYVAKKTAQPAISSNKSKKKNLITQ